MELSLINVAKACVNLTVVQIKELVLHLGVEQQVLDDIVLEWSGDDCKIKFFEEWLNRDMKASWGKLISGLKHIEMNVLAAHLKSTSAGMCIV